MQNELTLQLLVFEWFVPDPPSFRIEDRHPIGNEKAPPGPWLKYEQGKSRRYRPLEDKPALFRTFSELPIKKPRELQEAAVEFANRYGRLLVAEAGAFVNREPLSLWRSEIGEMQDIVDLLVAVEDEDWDQLNEWLQFGSGHVTYTRYEGGRIRHFLSLSNTTIRRWDSEALARVAHVVIQHILNHKLAEHTSSQVLYDPGTDSLGLHVMPSNLLGALYVEAAEAVTGNRDYRRCGQCSSWFAISPDIERGRSDRRYCSSACRSKAYRNRQEEAQRLRSEGMTPSAIARKLHSNTKTIRGWLGMKPTGCKTR